MGEEEIQIGAEEEEGGRDGSGREGERKEGIGGGEERGEEEERVKTCAVEQTHTYVLYVNPVRPISAHT